LKSTRRGEPAAPIPLFFPNRPKEVSREGDEDHDAEAPAFRPLADLLQIDLDQADDPSSSAKLEMITIQLLRRSLNQAFTTGREEETDDRTERGDDGQQDRNSALHLPPSDQQLSSARREPLRKTRHVRRGQDHPSRIATMMTTSSHPGS